MTYDFVRKYQHQVIPYEIYVYRLCRDNSIENASQFTGLTYDKCQRIFNYFAQQKIDNRDPIKTEYLGIDDFDMKKGHDYNTSIYDLATNRLIDIIEGRTKDEVISYLNTLSNDFKKNIKAVAIDMSCSYCSSVLNDLPNAKPVIDRLYIMGFSLVSSHKSERNK